MYEKIAVEVKLGEKLDNLAQSRLRERLALAMKSEGITAKEMANKLCITPSQFYRKLGGRNRFTVSDVIIIAKTFHKSIEFFVDYTGGFDQQIATKKEK